MKIPIAHHSLGRSLIIVFKYRCFYFSFIIYRQIQDSGRKGVALAIQLCSIYTLNIHCKLVSMLIEHLLELHIFHELFQPLIRAGSGWTPCFLTTLEPKW